MYELVLRRHRIIFIVFFILSFLVFSLSTSHAAVMPVYERVEPVTANVNAPTNVALDKNECLLVAESVNNRVLIYSQSGKYMGTISGLKRPISVSADGNLRIYIGNKDSGNVEVYNSGYELLFKLGSGDGEFSQPNDIEIGDTGKVYVVDKEEDVVKVYNADGTYSSTIGSSGNGDGQFHKPTSTAIDRAAGELIVLDRQLTPDTYGSLIEGARIQVFDMNGVFKRSFSRYGNLVGQMFRPQHVTVDGESRLYVTDSFHNVVIVYDSSGTYLGDVYDIDHPVRTPMGITIGGSNRLYTASLSTGKVEVYGIGQYTQMAVSPLHLTYEEWQCTDPAPQGIDITNNGNTVLNWTAEASESWIILSAASGSTPVSGVSALNIGVDLTGLASGNYSGTVSISAGTGNSEIVNVELTAASVPLIADPGEVYQGTEGQVIILDGSSSSGCITGYDWDIGNDGTYEYSSPSAEQGHSFASAGLYDIKLRVTDNGGAVEYATTTANILDSVPTASFTGSPIRGTGPLIVHFNNNSTGYDQPLTYEWDFNCDGTVDSNDESPSYTYAAGTYIVSLTVRDSDGSEEVLTRTNYITVDTGGCQNLPLKIGAVYYSTLQAAYNDATDGVTIQGQTASLSGDLIADRDITVSLAGGYDCEYTGISGETTLNGTITTGNGTLIIENIIVQ